MIKHLDWFDPDSVDLQNRSRSDAPLRLNPDAGWARANNMFTGMRKSWKLFRKLYAAALRGEIRIRDFNRRGTFSRPQIQQLARYYFDYFNDPDSSVVVDDVEIYIDDLKNVIRSDKKPIYAKKGRKIGSKTVGSKDHIILNRIELILRTNQAPSLRAAIVKILPDVEGHGVDESKIRRIERAYNARLDSSSYSAD